MTQCDYFQEKSPSKIDKNNSDSKFSSLNSNQRQVRNQNKNNSLIFSSNGQNEVLNPINKSRNLSKGKENTIDTKIYKELELKKYYKRIDNELTNQKEEKKSKEKFSFINSDQFEFIKNKKNKKHENLNIQNKEIDTLSSISDRIGINTILESKHNSKKIMKKNILAEDEYSMLNSSKNFFYVI